MRQTKLLWALIAVAAVAFVVGAFVVTPRETVSEIAAYPPAFSPTGLPGECGVGFLSPDGVVFDGSVGSDGRGCEPLDELFRRDSGPVVIRAYRTGDDGPAPGCGSEGTCPPPECVPIGYVSAGLSTDDAVGPATGPLYERAPEPVAASHGFFGVREGAPVVWAVVQVDSEVASVRARFDAGGDDQMKPKDGIAVLASPVRPGDDSTPPEPGGVIETLDEDGDVIETGDIPVEGVEGRVLSSPECAPKPPELPEPDGPPPADEAQAREAVTEAFTVAYAGASTPEERGSRIDDSEDLEGLREEVLDHFPEVPLDEITVEIEKVRFLNPTTAAVRYTIVLPGYSIPEFPNRIGEAVLVDGTWKVSRDTVCTDLALGNVTCPS